jgi:CelD/BcsL family acetyltransferase involved in cellulose biosynthesis
MTVIRSLREFAESREEWNRLAEGHGNPLLWHEWFLSCAEALHRADDLHVVVVERGQHLAAAAPLARTGVGYGEHLAFLGSDSLGEPSGFLYESHEALAELLDEVVHARKRLVLNRVAECDAALASLRSAHGRGVVLARRTAPSLAVRLQNDWSLVYRSWPAKLMQDFRRSHRRAEAFGAVSPEMASPDPGSVDDALRRFMEIEDRSWKGQARTALSCRPALRLFFESFARMIAGRRALRVGLLRIGGQPAAGMLAIEAYGRTWVLKIAFDERWRICSPGVLLTVEGMRDAAARGASSYEFLGSSEPWEERWRPDSRSYCGIAVYPFRWPAMVALGHDAVKALTHRASNWCIGFEGCARTTDRVS